MRSFGAICRTTVVCSFRSWMTLGWLDSFKAVPSIHCPSNAPGPQQDHHGVLPGDSTWPGRWDRGTRAISIYGSQPQSVFHLDIHPQGDKMRFGTFAHRHLPQFLGRSTWQINLADQVLKCLMFFVFLCHGCLDMNQLLQCSNAPMLMQAPEVSIPSRWRRCRWTFSFTFRCSSRTQAGPSLNLWDFGFEPGHH